MSSAGSLQAAKAPWGAAKHTKWLSVGVMCPPFNSHSTVKVSKLLLAKAFSTSPKTSASRFRTCATKRALRRMATAVPAWSRLQANARWPPAAAAAPHLACRCKRTANAPSRARKWCWRCCWPTCPSKAISGSMTGLRPRMVNSANGPGTMACRCAPHWPSCGAKPCRPTSRTQPWLCIWTPASSATAANALAAICRSTT